jgi:hypothetical protein
MIQLSPLLIYNTHMNSITKTCKIHGVLPLSDIRIMGGKSRCRLCKQNIDRKYAATNSAKLLYNRKHSHLKQTYNLTNENYEAMLLIQNSLCAICKQPETHKGRKSKRFPEHAVLVKRLSVDHNHSSGKIRGLLCHNCNVLLGNANDSIKILQDAISYLKKHGTSI